LGWGFGFGFGFAFDLPLPRFLGRGAGGLPSSSRLGWGGIGKGWEVSKD